MKITEIVFKHKLKQSDIDDLRAQYTPYKDKALPAVKGQALRQHLKSLSDEDLKLLIKTDIPHVSLKAQIVLDMNRYAQMRDPIASPLSNVDEKIDWQALRKAGVVMPMAYHVPSNPVKPDARQPNIITAWNLEKEKLGPGEKLTPFTDTEVTPQFWRQYMNQTWPTLQSLKKDQIRQSAKMKNVEFNENFADGKGPGRKGDSKRAGIPKGATIAQLKRIRSSKTASARKKQLAHWQINMRQGRKRNK